MHRPGMLRLLVSLLTVLSPIGPAVGSSRGPIDPLEQAAHEGDMGRVKALLAQEPGPYLLERALRFSIRAGHAEITDLLISRGVRYPLMIAAEEGDAKLVERLLAEVQEEKERDSALHATARIGHKEIVELLLSKGADANARRWGDFTPLFVAAAAGCDLETLQRFTNFPLSPWTAKSTERKRSPTKPRAFRDISELLIRHGADVNIREKQHGFVPLHYAVFGGSKEIVAALLDHGSPVNPAVPAGSMASRYLSPLHLAAHYGDLPICELLIARGAEVNSELPTDGGMWIYNTRQTPLHHAAQSGDSEVVGLLVAHGAQVHAADSAKETPLHLATRRGCQGIVDMLLSHGANASATDREGRTPLHHAAERKDRAIVESLLSYGADANRKSRDGRTPTSIATQNGSEDIVKLLTAGQAHVTIHAAASMGDIETMARLVKNGVDINRLDVHGQTAMHAAVAAGHLATVRWLVEHGTHLNLADNKGSTALSIALRIAQKSNFSRDPNEIARSAAMKSRQRDIVAFLLGQGGTLNFSLGMPRKTVLSHSGEIADLLIEAGHNLEPYCDDKATLLHRAAWWGNEEAVQNLITLGADLNAADRMGGTSLHAALQNGCTRYWDVIHGPHVKIVKVLLQHGARVNATNNHNITALHGAARYGHIEAMELLLAHGADPNIAADEGTTPLVLLLNCHWLTVDETKTRMKDFTIEFIRRGVRVDVQNDQGVTPLQQAAALDFPDLLEELLTRGAPVNAKSSTGWTPLHSAVAADSVRCVEMLLEHGTQVNSLGHSPTWVPGIPWHRFEKATVTPLHIAASQGNSRIVRLLIAAGADVNARGNDHKTPLHLASEKKHAEIVKILLDNGAEPNI